MYVRASVRARHFSNLLHLISSVSDTTATCARERHCHFIFSASPPSGLSAWLPSSPPTSPPPLSCSLQSLARELHRQANDLISQLCPSSNFFSTPPPPPPPSSPPPCHVLYGRWQESCSGRPATSPLIFMRPSSILLATALLTRSSIALSGRDPCFATGGQPVLSGCAHTTTLIHFCLMIVRPRLVSRHGRATRAAWMLTPPPPSRSPPTHRCLPSTLSCAEQCHRSISFLADARRLKGRRQLPPTNHALTARASVRFVYPTPHHNLRCHHLL